MAGMAGGIVLLTVMLLYLPPLAAIPIHGATQLLANSSRALLQRREVRWRVVWLYALPLLPLGAVGLPLAQRIPPDAAKIAIGVFALVATFTPGLLSFGAKPGEAPGGRAETMRFLTLGAVTGFLNPTIGATGPFQGPFFLTLGLSRQGVVGTFAACQTLGHLAKIVLFGLAGFAFAPYAGALVVLCTAAVAGTWIGTQLLGRMNERAFKVLFRVVLTAVSLRLILWDGLHLFG
jgi:uncharacterized membrane protein YfcA